MSTEYTDVVIVGAGLSGIGTAYHLQSHCPDKRYLILEARPAMGGTWDLFRYPGIRSDSDMHTLGYRFKPWTDGKAIADGPSILRYVRETAAEHGIERHIRYQHSLVSGHWSSDESCWTLEVHRGDTGSTVRLRCRFLLMCSGYFSYEQGYTPEFAGRERFRGPIVHPQHWPESLEYRNRRVIIIGSGATAMTLAPAMAEEAEFVTILQRSPGYVVSRPERDAIANFLRRLLPEKIAYVLTRWKNIALQQFVYRRSRKRPDQLRRMLLRRVRRELGPEYDIDRHFTPDYNPWDQRLCLVPDSDLFAAIRAGRVSMVTEHIDTFTERGVLLESGQELETDIIITATGLNMLLLGGASFSVDGKPVDFSRTFTYKGMMYSGVPNLIQTFGYINASWTLRADLTAEYTCRLINHMDARGYHQCVPQLREQDRDMPERPFVADFPAGYMLRAMHRFPRQGDREPWLNPQDYGRDRKILRHDPIEDGVLQFDDAGAETLGGTSPFVLHDRGV